MVRWLSAFPLLVIIACPGWGLAGERPVVAVFDVEDLAGTFERRALANLTEYLSVKLAEGGYQVIPRDQVRERLVLQKRGSYRECFDRSCQIELGRELAAQKVLSPRILRVAGRCQLTATLYDLKKAATETAASVEGSCDEESMGRAALKVSEKLKGRAGPRAVESRPVVPRRPPGAAVESVLAPAPGSPYSTWGHVTFWTGLGAATFGAVSGLLASRAGDDFKAGDREAYEKSVTLTGCMYTGLAAGGALIITGIALWALDPGGDRPAGSTSLSALPTGQGGLVLTLGGRF